MQGVLVTILQKYSVFKLDNFCCIKAYKFPRAELPLIQNFVHDSKCFKSMYKGETKKNYKNMK